VPSYAVPKFPAGGSISGHAAVAITAGRFVKQNATAPVNGNRVVGIPAAGARVCNVAGETAAAGSKILLHAPGQQVWVEGAQTLVAGDLVESDVAGRAVPRTTGIVCGEVVQGGPAGPVLIDFRPAFL
jgi:hypothetical protein